MDLEEDVKPYSAQHMPQTGIHQSKSHQRVFVEHCTQRTSARQASCISIDPGNDKWSVQNQGHMITYRLATSMTARISKHFSTASDYVEELKCSVQLSPAVHIRTPLQRKFLSENFDSHRWIFGAVAVLLDSAIDEIAYGATKVVVDKVINLRDGSASLLIQDDGGGMDPDSLQCCMVYGFSNTNSSCSIGQSTRHGFHAGAVRLGANVIIFTRCVNTSEPTQSIGLLSYASQLRTGQKHIIIPMVHYKYDPMTGEIRSYEKHMGQFSHNLSLLLNWSPYDTEEELLQNFDDIGHHGTKIVAFNLWHNAQSDLELDFDTCKEDIRVTEQVPTEYNVLGDKDHLAFHLWRSLRTYLSILYLRLPEHFKIILRGKEVKRRNLASELLHGQCITKCIESGREVDQAVVTSTIGFLDGAADVTVDRFCIYHKNRLIMPFIPVGEFSSSGEQGIIGVVEANHIEPVMNKQDFLWSEAEGLLGILKEIRMDYRNNLGGMLVYDQYSSQGNSKIRVSHNGSNLTEDSTIHVHCRLTPVPQLSSTIETTGDRKWAMLAMASSGMPSNDILRDSTPHLSVLPAIPKTEDSHQAMPVMAGSGMPSNFILIDHLSEFPIEETTGDMHQTMPTIANTWKNGKDSSATPVHHLLPPLQPNYNSMSSTGILRAPSTHFSVFSKTATAGNRNLMMPTMANTSAYIVDTSATPTHRAPVSSQHNKCGVMPSNCILKDHASHLPAIFIAAATGDRHQLTMPAMANNWANHMNSSANSSASAACAHRAPSYFQSDYRHVIPFDILKDRAPHLSALCMKGITGGRQRPKSASSVASVAPLLGAMSATKMNTIGLPQSGTILPAVLAALCKQSAKTAVLTYDYAAMPLAGDGEMLAAMDTAAGIFTEGMDASVTAAPSPAMSITVGSGASAFCPWSPPGFMPSDAKKRAPETELVEPSAKWTAIVPEHADTGLSSSSSQELPGDNNEEETGAKSDKSKLVDYVKTERE